MLAKDQESPVISQMRVLFGKPPLIKSESEEDYWELWEAFVEDIKPKRWPDWIIVNDLAHKYWEQLRLRRYSPALIEGACVEALASLLRPFFDNTTANQDVPPGIARNYYAGDTNAKKVAVRLLEKYGITLDQRPLLAAETIRTKMAECLG